MIVEKSHWLSSSFFRKFTVLSKTVAAGISDSGEYYVDIQQFIEELRDEKEVTQMNELLSTHISDESEVREVKSENSKKNKSIFISHSSKGFDFLDALKMRLEQKGVSSWLDRDELKVGQNWKKEIDTGIENS